MSACDTEIVIDAIDPAPLGAADRRLSAAECARVATEAAALIDVSTFVGSDRGSPRLLWRNDACEAWLNVSLADRDSGFHDHDGSCGGVHVIAGMVRGESLVVGGPRRTREYSAGGSFSFAGDAIHRVDHLRGAVTVHVYSPPLRSIGHYELVDGELRRTPCSPDEESPPSLALNKVVAGG